MIGSRGQLNHDKGGAPGSHLKAQHNKVLQTTNQSCISWTITPQEYKQYIVKAEVEDPWLECQDYLHSRQNIGGPGALSRLSLMIGSMENSEADKTMLRHFDNGVEEDEQIEIKTLSTF